MAKQFGLPKKERLKSRKQIDDLFATGKSFVVFPVRVSYKFTPATDDAAMQIGVTVSKRYFKKAVDRNRIKRLLREAYRLQKTELVKQLKESKKTGAVFFIYTDETIASFKVVASAIQRCLTQLQQKAANETIA